MNYLEPLQTQVNAIIAGAIALLPNLAVAILVLFITWIMARSAVRIAARLTSHSKFREDLKQLVATMIRLAIWITGTLLALTILIPSLTPAGLIGGLGIGALAIGFAFQDIFENFLAGVLIMLRDKMQIGDLVEAEGVLGKVERITLRETHLRQLSGELTILPNSMIFKNQVKIITDQPLRRDEVTVGVSYDTDLRQAESVIRAAVEALGGIALDKGVDVYAREFGGSSIDFLVRWWVDTGTQDLFGMRTDVVVAIYDALNAAEIEIPFAYVTHTFKDAIPLPREAA